MKPYRFYIFDMDGTLVDTRTDIARALAKMLEAAGRPVSDLGDVSHAIGGGAKNAVRLLTGLTGDALTPYLERFSREYERICCDNTRIYEGGEALLRRLKRGGAQLALVTMKSKAPTHSILQAHGLDMFDAVVTFDDVEKRKPDPDSLLALCAHFGVAVAETLVIGDTVTDVRYAQNAGADCCAVEYGYGDTNDILALSPTYTVKSLLDF